MTEDEWRSTAELNSMLKFIRRPSSDRKLRLLSCAYCRHNSWFTSLTNSMRLLESVEKWADGLVTATEVEERFESALGILAGAPSFGSMHLGFFSTDAFGAVVYTSAWALPEDNPDVDRWCCDQIRCLYGNPFRPIEVDNRWLSQSVLTLAQDIYEKRAFDLMPQLAVALRRADCIDPEIQDHCQSEQHHSRGCWVIDLLLGKN